MLLWRSQAIQNAEARLVAGTRRCDHITPVLLQLRWLPVRQWVKFKLAVLVYKALNNLAPPYLSDDCQLVATTGHHQLRSSEMFDNRSWRRPVMPWQRAGGHGPWTRVSNNETRVHGPLTLMSFLTTVFTARGHGPWTRHVDRGSVCTELIVHVLEI